jgi:hypothetical protein
MDGTVTISLKDFNYLQHRSEELVRLRIMLKRANQDGEAVMTEELKQHIEEIYQEI